MASKYATLLAQSNHLISHDAFMQAFLYQDRLESQLKANSPQHAECLEPEAAERLRKEMWVKDYKIWHKTFSDGLITLLDLHYLFIRGFDVDIIQEDNDVDYLWTFRGKKVAIFWELRPETQIRLETLRSLGWIITSRELAKGQWGVVSLDENRKEADWMAVNLVDLKRSSGDDGVNEEGTKDDIINEIKAEEGGRKENSDDVSAAGDWS